MGAEGDSSLICSHVGLGASILVGFVASEISGAVTVIALPIAALVISLSAFCKSQLVENVSSKRKRNFGDALSYFGIWMGVLEKMSAAATCARIASATIDYTSGGKFRDFLLGLESHSLGEPWPDVLGVTIVFVVTLLFMLGLEKSTYFSVLLYCCIGTSFLFFALVGGYYTNIHPNQWLEEFRANSYQSLMSATGMCAFGFSSKFPSNCSRNRKLKLAALILIPFAAYTSITLVYTFMSHYREVSGTAIPLVRVFEVRDVGWARPIMAVTTICVVCLALTEIIPALYEKIVLLANHNWQILIVPLLYRSSLTGAPILAIFTAGSLTSILAFACPLAYLIPLLNTSTLLKCSFHSTAYLYSLLEKDITLDSPLVAVNSGSNSYARLRNQSRMKRSSSYKLKVMMDLLPRFLRSSPLSKSDARGAKSSKTRKGASGDKEYLLLGDYNKVCTSDSESDVNDTSPNCTDAEESTSSTDIDAVVQEYKDRVQVATVSTSSEPKRRKQLNKFIVCSTIILIHLSSFILSFDITSKYTSFVWLNSAVLLFCVVTMASITPRNSGNGSKNGKWMAIIATVSVMLNVFFATPLLTIVWLGIGVWFLAGLLLFCRCNCCSCDGLFEKEYERVGLNPSKSDCSLPDIDLFKEKYIDTVYIQR